MTEAPAGQQWIDDLALPRQRAAIAWLAQWSRDQADVSSFSVGCSIGRGAADELSDVDGAIGVRAEVGTSGAGVIERVEHALVAGLPAIGEVVDILCTGSTSSDLAIRRVFVQYADRLQLDLAVVAEAAVRRGSAAPDFVTVHRASGTPEPAPLPSAYDVAPERILEWLCIGWRSLLDADKYLRRGSAWEAHRCLEDARGAIWQVWAAARGTSYPWHGLPQVLDECPDDLPPAIERTVAGLDQADLRRAVVAAAATLTACGRAVGVAPEPPIAAYVRGVLGA